MKRTKIARVVEKRMRVYRVVKVTKTVLQCERPYVLFGEAVRNLRIKREMTQQDLADALRVSRGSIANIEVGRQRVLLSDAWDFAKALGVKPMFFFNAVSR